VLATLSFSMHADTLLVANRGGSTITLIDPATMTTLGAVSVGFDPHEIAVSADGSRAYVSNYGNAQGTTLSVIDIAARTKLKDVSIAPLLGPHGIVERNGRIWFTAEGSQSVGRYDPVEDRVDWVGRTNQPQTHMLVVNRAGDTVYTANISAQSASVIPVTGTESTASKTIATVVKSEGIALSPDERELWIGSASTGGIAIIDLATETVAAFLSPGAFAYRLAFTSDGRSVLVPRQQTVVVYDAVTRTQVRAIPVGGTVLSVLVAPGDRIAFVATVNPSRVLKLDLETQEILGATAVAPTPDGLALAVPAPPGPHRKRRAARS
jgi:DNA-binding beta-propeller fold protein YncE